MPNSNQTQTPFTANQYVLVPSISNASYLLQRCAELDKLYITTESGERFYYLDNGKVMSDDVFSDLFHDTLENRKALNALYAMDYPIETEQQAKQNISNNNVLLNSEQQTEQQSEPSLIPLYSVLRNGEPIFITGSIQTAHVEHIANDIMHHLQAVSDDEYSLQVVQWIDNDNTATSTYTDTWDNETSVNSNKEII